ncbi:hypothetical protein ART_3685 [Arthrobacter sp. PAMC 25486]|nr:hypothetical protein ART_3685 [Arthrobacter sp. PAMC 25486]
MAGCWLIPPQEGLLVPLSTELQMTSLSFALIMDSAGHVWRSASHEI